MLPDFTTLCDLLQYRAENQPDQRAYTLLPDGETEGPSLTYRQLDQLARYVAGQLQSLNATGERVLLLYPTCLEYIVAFFGCIYAGAIAVPAFPPRFNRSSPRVQSIARDSQAAFALTTNAILDQLQSRLRQNPELSGAHLIGTSLNNLNSEAPAWVAPHLSPKSIAYLQYTSGSTATPKGVIIQYDNLMHHLESLLEIANPSQDASAVSYLPLYHDFGLVIGVLMSLYVGIPLFLMPPTAFIQKPIRWLRAITRYRATYSFAPSFAYQFCVNHISPEEAQNLDLRFWKASFCGAETVDADALQAFKNTFAPYGLDSCTVLPCYGLAEATVGVSSNRVLTQFNICHLQSHALERGLVVESSKGEKSINKIVSCGKPLSGLDVAIVDPETFTRCSMNQIGEIWVSGASIASGYWNCPEETRKTFEAQLEGDKGIDYLRTGDLGFLKNGELYVTGRLKDIIIIRGLNHYPQDIELTVEKSHFSIQPNGCAAFSISIEGDEKVIILVELKRTHRKTDPS